MTTTDKITTPYPVFTFFICSLLFPFVMQFFFIVTTGYIKAFALAGVLPHSDNPLNQKNAEI